MKRIVIGRWLVAALFVTLAAGVFATAVAAAQQEGPRRKFRDGDDITVAANETVSHDFYVAADTLVVDGRIEGDLTVLAREVEINGAVAGDVLGAASRVTIRGAVDGDVRVLGARVTLEGQIGKDLLAAARDLDLEQSSRIRGDLIYFAADSNLQGSIEGGILSNSREAETAGAGPLLARSAGEGATASGDAPSQQEERRRESRGNPVLRFFLHFITLVLAGVLLLIVSQRTTWRAAGLLRRQPLRSVGVGLLTLVALLIALLGFIVATFNLFITRGGFGETALVVVLAFFSLIGGSVLLFLLLMVAIFFGQAITGLAAGRLILQRVRVPGQALVALLVGALLISLLTMLPVVGAIVTVLATIFGFGALVLSSRVGEDALEGRPASAA